MPNARFGNQMETRKFEQRSKGDCLELNWACLQVSLIVIFNYMIKYILILIAFICIPQIGQSQSKTDSLLIDELRNMELITDIYSIPHNRYHLDHFVFVRKTVNMDPEVQYNKGKKITNESKLFLNRIKPRDTLMIKEVYALNSESPATGLIKLPEKKFLVK